VENEGVNADGDYRYVSYETQTCLWTDAGPKSSSATGDERDNLFDTSVLRPTAIISLPIRHAPPRSAGKSAMARSTPTAVFGS